MPGHHRQLKWMNTTLQHREHSSQGRHLIVKTLIKCKYREFTTSCKPPVTEQESQVRDRKHLKEPEQL